MANVFVYERLQLALIIHQLNFSTKFESNGAAQAANSLSSEVRKLDSSYGNSLERKQSNSSEAKLIE